MEIANDEEDEDVKEDEERERDGREMKEELEWAIDNFDYD